jgi:hypothetical protein
MASRSELYTPSPAVRRVAGAFRLAGWVGFWGQIVLAVVSSLVLLFAVSILNVRSSGANANAGTGFGSLFAICGLILLYAGAYWAFRYTRLSRQLKTANPPKRGDAIQAVRIGLMINLAGMFVTLLGAETIVGTLFGKATTQPQAGAIYDPSRFTQYINALDLFVVQANINTVLAHFVGLTASLWLVRCLSRR